MTQLLCVVNNTSRSHVRSVGHVFAYLYTLDDDSERPMNYETSLLPKVFPQINLMKEWSYFPKNIVIEKFCSVLYSTLIG